MPTKDTPKEVLVAPLAGSALADAIRAAGGLADIAEGLPVIDVIGSFAGLGALPLLGITLGLTTGAPPPVESLTGSGLEPQPATALPPAPPGQPPPVAAAPLLPFNWWDLGNPPLPFGGTPVSWVGLLGRLGAAGETLVDLLSRPSPIGVDPNANQQPVSGTGLPGVDPGMPAVPVQAPAPVTTITVIGTPPAGAPAVVPSPVLAPIGLPESPPPPGVLPHFGFTVPVPVIPGPNIFPATGPTQRPTGPFGPASPTFSPVLNPGLVTVPTPAPVRVPSPLSPFPGPATGVAPIVATPLPVAQLPGLDQGAFAPLGFIAPSAASPFDQPEEQGLAQAASHANQCETTKQKAKPRKPRTVCHAGTYIERSKGTSKSPQRVIPCR